MEKKPRPWGWGGGVGGYVFWRIMKAWTILVEGHQGNIPAKLHLTRSDF